MIQPQLEPEEFWMALALLLLVGACGWLLARECLDAWP